jgi:hypothetical protein
MELGKSFEKELDNILFTPIYANLATKLECESFMKIRIYNMIYHTLSLNTNYGIRL